MPATALSSITATTPTIAADSYVNFVQGPTNIYVPSSVVPTRLSIHITTTSAATAPPPTIHTPTTMRGAYVAANREGAVTEWRWSPHAESGCVKLVFFNLFIFFVYYFA